MYAIDVCTSLAYKLSGVVLDDHKVDPKIFEALLDAARARRDARRKRLARLILGAPGSPHSAPPQGVDVCAVRGLTALSQAKFAELLGIELATLRNWEQGRRDPTGPARALLRAIGKDPVGVIRALTS
jgi:putative transcriptional regulator